MLLQNSCAEIVKPLTDQENMKSFRIYDKFKISYGIKKYFCRCSWFDDNAKDNDLQCYMKLDTYL